MRRNDDGLEDGHEKIENVEKLEKEKKCENKESQSPVSDPDHLQPLSRGLQNLNDSITILQRTSSLGMADSYRLSRFRPVSLSVNEPSSTCFPSSLEAASNPLNVERSSPAPVLTSGASSSLFSFSPQFCFHDKSWRRSGERVSGVDRPVGRGFGGLVASGCDPSASFTRTSSPSQRSSYLVPPIHQIQTSNLPSTPNPAIDCCSSIPGSFKSAIPISLFLKALYEGFNCLMSI